MTFSTYSCNFDTGAYISMGDVLGFEYTQSFSVSCWCMPSVGGDDGAIVSKQLATITERGYALICYPVADKVRVVLSNTASSNEIIVEVSSAGINNGHWHHVVVTWDGNASPGAAGVGVYIDNVLQSATIVADTLSATIISGASFMLGSRNATDFWYGGTLDEVAVYNRELTATEVEWIYNAGLPRDLSLVVAPIGLVAWWRMGEWVSTGALLILDSGPSAVPNTVRDLSGNNYNGTMTNMEAADVVYDAPGRGQCFAFNGTGDTIQFNTASGSGIKAWERTDRFSVSFWARMPSGGGGNVCSKISAGYRGWWISAGPTGCSLVLNNTWATNCLVANASTSLSVDRWHHFVLAYDGSSTVAGVTVYVDGVVVTTSVGYDNLTASIIYSVGDTFIIGATGASYFNGRMRDLALWDVTLTVSEVTWIYNAGQPRDLYEAGGPGMALAAWWRLGNGDKFPQIYDSGPLPAYTVAHCKDQSFNNYDGIMTNMESTDIVYDAPGHGKSVMFDGVNEYATAGNVLGFERTDPFSMSCWFRAENTSACLFGKQSNSVSAPGYCIWINSTGLQLQLVNTQGSNQLVVRASNFYLDGKWHHVVFCYDGSSVAANVRCYIDGSLVSLTTMSDTLTASIITASPFELAGRDTGANFKGRIHHAAVYSKFLSQVEAEWIYNDGVPPDLTGAGAPSNLAAWWKCGVGDAHPTLQDSGPSNYDATMTNMESYDIVADAPNDPYYFAQKSLLFDGTNEYVNCGNVLGFERTNSFSISCWFRTSSPTGYLLAKRRVSVDRGYSLGVTVAGVIEFTLCSDSSTSNYLQVLFGSGLGNDAWHHVVICYNGTSLASGVTCYIDGVSEVGTVVQDTLTGTILISENLWLGGGVTASPGWLFPGNIDEVAVYSRVLTSSEVSWIYNSGVPCDLKNTSGAPLYLAAWWRMGEGGYRNSSADGTWQTRILGDGPGLVSDFAVRCLSFDGVLEYVDMGNVLAYERTQPFSISCWARWISDDYGAFVSKMDGSYVGYCLYKAPGGRVSAEIQGSGGGRIIRYSNYGLGNGFWHHVVATYDGSSTRAGLRVYVDGVDVTTGGADTLSASIVTKTALLIGRRQSDLSFTGNVDEVSIYNKELSAAEVGWIYNLGIPRDLKDVDAPLNLQGWWRMGEGAYPGTTYNMIAGDFLYPGVYVLTPPPPTGHDIDRTRFKRTYSRFRQVPSVVSVYDPNADRSTNVDITRLGKTYSGARIRPVRVRLVGR